jgi:hypothetical protein
MIIRIKKAISRFLEDIAKENEKQFGKEKLDCCKLNGKQKR